MNSNYSDLLQTILGNDEDYEFLTSIIDMTGSSNAKARKAWALRMNDKNIVDDQWKDIFIELAKYNEWREAQDNAAEVYVKQARVIANNYGLVSDRGFALALNIAVHAWAPYNDTNAERSRVRGLGTEAERMMALTNKFKDYAYDVYNRCKSIAEGTGSVHGRDMAEMLSAIGL